MPPPERFGEFQLIRPLHRGGMAAVWLAKREGSDPVALKLVHARFADDPSFCAMLQEEARVAARVTHENVVPILEVGEVDGTPYLVMEHCDGASLAQILDAQKSAGITLPAPVAVAIACRAADGLHAAHEARGEDGQPLELVHRDVSPSNIMISASGAVRIIDFGVARARGRAIKTSAGTLKGKYAYMPPEAVSAQPIDRRSDLYSLAIVLWESLTGRRYFESKLEIEILMMARRPRYVPASELRSGVPSGLDDALARALATRPEDRFDTVAQLAASARAAVPGALAVDAATLGRLAAR